MHHYEPSRNYDRREYGPIPERLRSFNFTTPDRRGWGKPCNPDTMRRLYVPKGDGKSYQPTVRRELAELITFLLTSTMRLGYQISLGSYTCRKIAGTNQMSNHSWGMALDINSRANPFSSTWRANMPPRIVDLWESARFYWGGRYSGRYDPQHFEFIGRPSDVAAEMANARAAFDRLWTPLHPLLSIGDSGERVVYLQSLLNKHNYVLIPDGQFGPITQAAVVSFQGRIGLASDGYVGPLTWTRLEERP